MSNHRFRTRDDENRDTGREIPNEFDAILNSGISLQFPNPERNNFMNDERNSGDQFTVGDISNSQGIAIGPNATAQVTGNNSGDIKIDAKQLRIALKDLHDALAQADLPRDASRSAQISAENAINAVNEKEVASDVVVENVKKVGETIKQANIVVHEGTSLWQSIKQLGPLLGPLVGNARIVAAWFGVSL